MLNILIADDDEGDRKLMTRCLEQSGLHYKCTESSDMAAALAACKEQSFDCALLDYRMPGCDGLDGISVLSERYPFMPLLMLTAKGDETVATEAMKRGAADYVSKARLNAQSIKDMIDSAIAKVAVRRKLSEQRHELETFAGGLVHDLQAPIAAIQTFADLLDDDIQTGRVAEKCAENCRGMVQAARRLGKLIDALYQYTKADAETSFDAVDMDGVAAEALAALQHLVAERGARVSCGDLPMVIGNGPQLTQLLLNLFDNAIKYADNSRPIVKLSAAPAHEHAWLFKVTDNGPGISEPFREAVFEPFRRLPSAGKYDGAGLGLATCRKILERHRGLIWCESKEGEGTTFFFVLPCCFQVRLRD